MAKRNNQIENKKFWESYWFKTMGLCFGAGSVVATILVFYYKNHEDDIKDRFQDKLEFQKKDCERDNEERMLKLKLEIQSEYFVKPSAESPTAKKMEKVFNRIDKTKRK